MKVREGPNKQVMSEQRPERGEAVTRENNWRNSPRHRQKHCAKVLRREHTWGVEGAAGGYTAA